MKTLLIALYPYQSQGLDAWHDHGAGMTYTACKKAGCDIDFLDLKTLHNDNELEQFISTCPHELIAFGLKSSYYDIGMKIITYAKRYGKKTLVGGYHATAAGHELVENPNIDYIFYGESEVTLPKFLQAPEKFNREITGEKPQRLDDLVWFDRSIYSNVTEPCTGWWYGGKHHKMISVMSARGCPYQCQFCQPIEDNHFGKKLRRRSAESLIEEILWLKDLHKPDCLMIHDDTFLVQESWIEDFIDLYPKVGLPFWASGRADGIVKNKALVKELVKLGWELVSVGFESGSQRILDLMHKGTTVEQNLEAAEIIHSTGAKIYGNYMLGLPWETARDMQDTARMVDKIRAEMPSWAFFTPYPGSGLGYSCIENAWSLLSRSEYDRYPGGKKVRFVNYDYVNKVFRGFREEVREPLCDIIIPTYNNEDLTIACLESIKQCTTPGTYRVIWVDNCSQEKSKVEKVIECFDHLTINMPKNEGFVGAINAGLQQSKAPFVCLLNNDTLVSPNWLEKLIKILNASPKLGILGTLTEASTAIDPLHMDSHHSLSLHKDLVPNKGLGMTLADINKHLETHYSGHTYDISFVAFLCAVIKREVLDKIGLLDPNYAMGMWDDNDYNEATRRAGWETKIAIDTCIYHRGRSTFANIQAQENFNVDKLLRTNKKYLDTKWNSIDTSIISRAIFDKLSEVPDLGNLTSKRLELIQRYFINSLKNQTDKGFNIQMIVGPDGNEATEAIMNLDWSGLKITFYPSTGLDEWRKSAAATGNNGHESISGTPEMIAKMAGYQLSPIMIRLDSDDWVAPGFIANVHNIIHENHSPYFIINYLPIIQDEEGLLYQSGTTFNSAQISPFFVMVQKGDKKINLYETCHFHMAKGFSQVITVNPGYCYTVIHEENRINKLLPNDKAVSYFFDKGYSTPKIKRFNITTGSKDSWQERIANANVRVV